MSSSSFTRTSTILRSRRQPKVYKPSENVLRNVIYSTEPELFVSGPAGTGKSRAILEKIYMTLCKYEGARALIFRKIKSTLNNTGLITWERHVLPANLRIRRHSKLDNYTLPNGSVLDIAGMDDPEKIKSGEWDMAFGQEITECDEADWDMVSSRLRNGVVPYQMIIGDCNPSHPKHWVKVRSQQPHPDEEVIARNPQAVRTRMVETYHTDNPVYWDEATKAWTPQGREYIGRLRALTGVTRLRLYKGLWVAAEGVVFDMWDDEVHLLPREFKAPDDWYRFWTFDFGYSAPMVWQEWLCAPTAYVDRHVSLRQGDLILYREIYKTRNLVEDIAKDIRQHHIEKWPTVAVADHDAEGRATLERHLSLNTAPAFKDIQIGTQHVMNRMMHRDSPPRLYIRKGARVHEADPFLVSASKPTCTEDEILGYTWNPESTSTKTITTQAGLKKVELPLQVNDHGIDAMRYLVAQFDEVGVSDGIYF